MVENYPKNGDPGKYPNCDIVETMTTKVRVFSKCKRIRSHFKKAVDGGKKRDTGKNVSTFYTIYQNTYENRRAVTAIGNFGDSSYSGNRSLFFINILY